MILTECSVLHGATVLFEGTRNECLAFRSMQANSWALAVNTPVEEVLRKFWAIKSVAS